jgi:hypothetical protein
MKYFENVPIGKSWQFKSFLAEYRLSVTNIDFSTGLVKIEIEEARGITLPSLPK